MLHIYTRALMSGAHRRTAPIVRILGGLSVATGLFLTTNAVAGELKGHVDVPPAVQRATVNPYPGLAGTSTVPEHGGRHGSAANDVVVYLTGANVATTSVRERPVDKLYQINQHFEPRVLGVPVGATVDFPNKDTVFHNVFSYSKTKKFDLGYYGKGKSKQVTFDKPGLVKVFCDIHSTMSAFILVVDTPFVTRADDNGDYRFNDVPPGTYTVNYWHPEHGTRTDTVVVGHDIATSSMRY